MILGPGGHGRKSGEDWSEETRQKKVIIHNHVHVYFSFLLSHTLYTQAR